MRSIAFRNKLIVKIFIAVTIGLLGSFGVMIGISLFISYLFTVKYLAEESVVQYGYVWLLFMYSAGILTFIAIFLFLVRKKLIYLKHISQSINYIANGKLGLTIRLEGKDELTQLVENINYMSKEIENKFEHERRLESAKNELITNVSHDLRTPLTSIIGYVDLLRHGQYDTISQHQEYLETIYSKSQRLKSLIDELFEYTRLSSPDVELNLSEVDLTGIMEQIIGEYTPIFEKEQLLVEKKITDENVPVVLDVEKMVRVYENLFTNAIKYSLKPSKLYINLETKENKAILKVSNRTENPSVGDVNKLFERFFRGDKSRRDNGGTGLGLAISKRIVELHDGTIRAEYKDGWMNLIVEYPLIKQKLMGESCP
ncbi:sensor histidine kinase [Brevibacillus brevis]|uniref:sensor histidine kinase n=1 Tax=Brevibacillus brevis TaxID=1393 RepID=UPI00115C32D0|nr:HAMP domain-containing sensor histidine kinase [Lysinibacillus sp. SDF0063]TQR36410.1 GHKL domain-containing protein [Lysinibacillus sp. SDF0063]